MQRIVDFSMVLGEILDLSRVRDLPFGNVNGASVTFVRVVDVSVTIPSSESDDSSKCKGSTIKSQ